MLEEYKDAIKTCAYCPKLCRFACPVAEIEKSESTTPYAKATLADLLLKGKIKLKDEVNQIFYKCLECKLCDSYCLLDIDMPAIIRAARFDISNSGKKLKAISELEKSMENFHNPYNLPESKKINPGEKIKTRADIIYFAGCTTSYLVDEIFDNISEILKKTKTKFTLLHDEEWCCGLPYISLGLFDKAKELAERNQKLFHKLEASTIISGCPGCIASFKLFYPELGFPIKAKIMHLTELAEELIKNKKIKLTKSFKEMVTYQDPCHLGRYLEIYEPPRNILNSIPGLKLKEMFWTGQFSRCCGGGGSLRLTNYKTASAITNQRIEEAKQTGSHFLITACPSCYLLLNQRADRNLEVKDISEMINQSLSAK